MRHSLAVMCMFLVACSSGDGAGAGADAGTGADADTDGGSAGDASVSESDSGVDDGGIIDSTPVDVTPGDGGGASMTFFVSSSGNGASGGNYGGLTGADARCPKLATALRRRSKTSDADPSTAPPPRRGGALGPAR